jgi:hypothetical protein
VAQVVLTFEGGTDGTDLTAANSGATTISKQGTSTARFRSSAASTGSLGAEFAAVASSYSFARVLAAAESASTAAAMEFICPTLPASVDRVILAHRAGGTTPGSLAVNCAITPSGKIRAQAGGVTIVNPFPTASTGDNVLIPGQAYLLEQLVSGQSETAGRVDARLTRKSTGAVLGTVQSLAANVTANPIAGVDFGVSPTTDQAFTMLVDNCRVIDNNTVGAWPGWYAGATNPLTASAVVSPTSGTVPFVVTCTATAAGGSGTSKTYAFNWGDGSTTAAQSSNVATHTYATPGTYTVTVTVTSA